MSKTLLMMVAMLVPGFSQFSWGQQVLNGVPSDIRREQVKNTPQPNGPGVALETPLRLGKVIPPTNDLKNSPALTVTHDPSIQSLRLSFAHQRAAQILTQAELLPPNDRIEYFKESFKDSSRQIQGWNAMVSHIQAIEGGTIVTLRVYAKLDIGAASTYLIERYSVVNGKVSYQGAIPPANTPHFTFH
jgi:hypothetical protein